jgi:hypothetical protein
MLRSVEKTSQLGFAMMIWLASAVYKDAEVEWRKPNECVELSFDPPSDTRVLRPNESTQVSVEVRTKEGGTPVPWMSEDVSVLQAGTVSPRSVELPGDEALTYTASAQPKRGHGIGIKALSHAGIAGGEWHIADDAVELTLEHRTWHSRSTPSAASGSALFDGTVKFDVTLRPTAPVPEMLHGQTSTVRRIQVGHITPRCRGSATQAEDWDVNATLDAERQVLLLDLANYPVDGRGSWTCPPGGTEELDVMGYLPAVLGRVEVPAIIGTPQTFQIRRDDDEHETLTVTIRASPIAR